MKHMSLSKVRANVKNVSECAQENMIVSLLSCSSYALNVAKDHNFIMMLQT